jgi:hypothetical protein
MTSPAAQKMMLNAVRASSFRVGIPASCIFQKFEIVGDGVEVAAR